MTTTNPDTADTAPALDPAEERRIAYQIAAELGADFRSVVKVLRGGTVRGLVGARIKARLDELRRPAA